MNNPNERIISCVIKLIDVLQNSCTQYAEASGDDSHEHDLFDNVDRVILAEIKNELESMQENDDGICSTSNG